MEDLRIQKTRKALKSALIKLLETKSFEKISVTDICKESNISRITFYTHYDHKYDLVEEIFNDFREIGRNIFKTKYFTSQSSGLSKDAQNFANILECVYEIINTNKNFFSHISQEENPYLLSVQNRILLDTIDKVARSKEVGKKLKYDPRQITGFLIYGISGFIAESSSRGISDVQCFESAKRLIIDLFEKGIFYE